MVQRFWRSAPRYLLEELLEVMMDILMAVAQSGTQKHNCAYIRRIVVYYRTYYDEELLFIENLVMEYFNR